MSASIPFPANHPALCPVGHFCPQAVARAESGRWFVTFGHAGFNSRANNGSGFATKKAAVASIEKHERPSFRAGLRAAVIDQMLDPAAIDQAGFEARAQRVTGEGR